MTVSDTFVRLDCRGVVFGPDCPSSFVQQTIVKGNLEVSGDEKLGGGELKVEGKCDDEGCNENNFFRLPSIVDQKALK